MLWATQAWNAQAISESTLSIGRAANVRTRYLDIYFKDSLHARAVFGGTFARTAVQRSAIAATGLWLAL